MLILFLTMLQIAERVREGYRPEMPEYVPAAIESLIQDCWKTDAGDRPSFLQVIEYVRPHFPAPSLALILTDIA